MGQDRRISWTRDFLTRRIDRCYRVASWTRIATKRARYLSLARYYRSILAIDPPAPAIV
jgi:hypothetical protein